jgi:coenzyme F420-reducing hydrogenase delta subunit
MLDCPYEAIAMVRREGDIGLRSELVARVDPALCVSCGICAGSCAPMGVGPPDRTGRDQVADVRAFLADRRPGPRDIVVVGCGRSAAGDGLADAPLFPVSCAGNLHTSVIELLIRGGAGGVLVVSCPMRDCWNREGVRWLEQRVHHDREAELKERVDRDRVRLIEAAAAEWITLQAHLETFRGEIATLAEIEAEASPEPDTTCDPALEPEEALTWRDG